MRRIQNQALLDEFVSEQDEELTANQIKEIVSTPFAYLKEKMAESELPTIRLKYFGTFVVYEKRAKDILNRTYNQFEKGSIGNELFEKRKKMLDDFLEKRKEDS